jgi:hypothetical protein
MPSGNVWLNSIVCFATQANGCGERTGFPISCSVVTTRRLKANGIIAPCTTSEAKTRDAGDSLNLASELLYGRLVLRHSRVTDRSVFDPASASRTAPAINLQSARKPRDFGQAFRAELMPGNLRILDMMRHDARCRRFAPARGPCTPQQDGTADAVPLGHAKKIHKA